MAPDLRERFVTSRLPAIGTSLTVLACDGRTWRALSLARAGGELHVERAEEHAVASSDAPPPHFARWTQNEAALVVTHEAVPAVILGDQTDDDRLQLIDEHHSSDGLACGFVRQRRSDPETRSDCLMARMPRARRSHWQSVVERLGLRLEGIYPLLGSALAGIQDPGRGRPRLVLQLEAEWIAIIEAVGASCRAIDVYAEPPTLRRCMQLIGEGLEEIVLCGGGVDLSAFGYELVRSGQTWPWLSRPRGGATSLPASFTPLLGAARHACGLAPLNAVACVPPARV